MTISPQTRESGKIMPQRLTAGLIFFALFMVPIAMASEAPSRQNRVFEWTFESHKTYADPFNQVDVDVVFSKGADSWRVPAFWRGGNQWTVRFAPPAPGDFAYHLESTDKSNPDLNGHEGHVSIAAYTGPNPVLRHGALRVSANKRYFEHADRTPFYWLGDTWWSGMSTRLSWEGFQKLTADRKAKGFTVVQIVAGLVPGEEQAPSDPGYCNEGGCVWDAGFQHINPRFFDYVDRRVQHLVDSEIIPALVGAWSEKISEMGAEKIKKHWRYVIARYGAYPVFWIVGGEVYDPPEDALAKISALKTITNGLVSIPPLPPRPGWTEVARYVRATDPYHHPVTVHEGVPWWSHDYALQDESLLDFNLLQEDHAGWPSIANEVAQLDLHHARTSVTKPQVIGEIGYEAFGGNQLQDFQRTAFWLAMLNGAAGHTYGAVGSWESYTADKPFQRMKWSLMTWEEGMNLPGSYEIGLGSKLLRQYEWWKFEPHPEWVTPRGTTLLEPRSEVRGFDVRAEWQAKKGDFYLPYAAGIPGEVRFIYLPYFTMYSLWSGPPTVLGLESGVRYHAYYWEPVLGVKIDLGSVERPTPGEKILEDNFNTDASEWADYGARSSRGGGQMSGGEGLLAVRRDVNEADISARVDARSDADAALVLRYHDADNYLTATYSHSDHAIYLFDRTKGADGTLLGRTDVPDIGENIQLSAEVRGSSAIVSVSDGKSTYSSPIVKVANVSPGAAGLKHGSDSANQIFKNFLLRKTSVQPADSKLQTKLYDARGIYRGELSGPGYEDFGRDTAVLLDAYKPPKFPTTQDWVLVLEAQNKH
jgi:hypothetical protein